MESKAVFDFGFHAVDSGSQVMDSGFRIPIISEIPDSLGSISNSKARDSRIHKQKFPGFRPGPNSLT